MSSTSLSRTIGASVTEALYQWVRKIAYQRGCSEAQIVREAVLAYQKKKGA